MRFKAIDSRKIVLARLRAHRAGVDVPLRALADHYLARGDVDRVVAAMIDARAAGLGLPWNTACALDLAGIDAEAAVSMALERGLSVEELGLTQRDLPRLPK